MKVALVHDYIKEYGGAERVLEAFHEIWPEAPIFTSVFLPDFLGPHKDRFLDWDIRASFLQGIPRVEKLISPLRVVTPWIFENINFLDYDLVIVSATGAYFPNLIVTRSDALHICYYHTPPRYLYGYPTARNWKSNLLGRVIGEFFNHNLRQLDFLSAQRADDLIANSEEVKKRIQKFYRREAEVICPPVGMVDKSNSKVKSQKSKLQGKYYLAGGRLARPKHIELAIEACNQLKLPLKVFGRSFAGYGEELNKLAGNTVEFIGEVNDEELIDLYRKAKALIYPSEKEDFGIMPVESQACGTPVIGLAQGGTKETVIDGKTGVLFDKLDVESIVAAIKRLDKIKITSFDCHENAKKFSKERFKREIKNLINSKLKTQNTKPNLKT